VTAFAPGRVNLIGEQTDFNDGLSLPFAIGQGVRVTARPLDRGRHVIAHATDLDATARLPLRPSEPNPRGLWSDYVRGALAELHGAGYELVPAELEITGDLARGGGLSSSAALESAIVLALLAVAGIPEPDDRVPLAKLCSAVENRWVGARTGLLDQLTSLLGQPEYALRIDFRTLDIRTVPLRLDDWRLVVVPSGQTRRLARGSGYEQRRQECDDAKRTLGLETLRDATRADLARLPAPLNRRVRHVIEENERVDQATDALASGDLPALGALLNASHASLRDLYECSTDAVETAVARIIRHGATGARLMGGGFGGYVLALLPPEVEPPADATLVAPAPGAHLISG
jgi:galactokinase